MYEYDISSKEKVDVKVKRRRCRSGATGYMSALIREVPATPECWCQPPFAAPGRLRDGRDTPGIRHHCTYTAM